MADTPEPAAGEPWWLARQLTRAHRNSLTDNQLLARYRHRHGNPYMPLAVAKQMWRVEARYAHLGVAFERRRQEELEAKRAELLARVFPATDLGEADLKHGRRHSG